MLSLLAGIRTEEARALHWAHVDLDGDPAARPPVPPHVAVWRVLRPRGFSEARGYPKLAESSRQCHDTAIQRRLWTVSEELTGVAFPV